MNELHESTKFSSKNPILISLKKVFFFSQLKTLNFSELLPQIITKAMLRGLFDKYDNYGRIKCGENIQSNFKDNNFMSGILRAYHSNEREK
jgi:hypothetical protein